MRKILLTLAMIVGLMVPATTASAQLIPDLWDACDNVSDSAVCSGSDDDVGSFVTRLVNFLLWVVGLLAVVMIIFGGVKYITSAGDTAKVTSAKNTILYSVIGLIAAIFAYAIVAWVSSNVS